MVLGIVNYSKGNRNLKSFITLTADPNAPPASVRSGACEARISLGSVLSGQCVAIRSLDL